MHIVQYVCLSVFVFLLMNFKGWAFYKSISINTIAYFDVGLLMRACYPKRSYCPLSDFLSDLCLLIWSLSNLLFDPNDLKNFLLENRIPVGTVVFYSLRDHPFKLKGVGGGAVVFFGVKIVFFASQRRRFFSATLFFFYKNNIF